MKTRPGRYCLWPFFVCDFLGVTMTSRVKTGIYPTKLRPRGFSPDYGLTPWPHRALHLRASSDHQ